VGHFRKKLLEEVAIHSLVPRKNLLHSEPHLPLLTLVRGFSPSESYNHFVVEKVLGLYREKYFDLNVRHFHEKLQEEHQVEISYSWVKGILQGE
jgi:hypothetical protein